MLCISDRRGMVRILLISIILFGTIWSYTLSPLIPNTAETSEDYYNDSEYSEDEEVSHFNDSADPEDQEVGYSNERANYTLKWGKIPKWTHVGGKLKIECILEGGDLDMKRFGHDLEITCNTKEVKTRYDYPGRSQVFRIADITNVTAENHCLYVCNHYYELDGKKEFIQSIEMMVEVAPKKGQIKVNDASNFNVIVKSGELFSLQVNMSIYPDSDQSFSAKWIRQYNTRFDEVTMSIINDSTYILYESKSSENRTNILTVQNAQTNLSGTYVLVIRILDTEEIVKFNVFILSETVKPKLQIVTQPTDVILGQTYYDVGKEVKIICSGEGIPLPAVRPSYRFLNDPDARIPVAYDQYINGTFESSITWSAIIKENMEINCEAILGNMTRNERATIRAVDDEPWIFHSVNSGPLSSATEVDSLLYEGDDMVLQCKYPKYTEWEWMLNGKSLENDLDIATTAVSKSLTLNLRNMTVANSGEYRCVPTASPDELKKIDITVHEVVKPMNVDRGRNETVELQFGQNATLLCRQDGVPPPLILWFKDDEPYTQGILKDNNRTLYIQRVAREDEGKFVCRATNRAGTNEIVYRTTVLGAPKRLTPLWLSSISGALLLLVCCLIIFGFIIWKQRKNTNAQKKALSILYDQLMREIKVPPPTKEEPLDKKVSDLPYKKEYEVDRDMLTIADRKLGEGFFGLVWAGRLNRSKTVSDDEMLPVAIKSPKNAMNPEDHKALADELRILCAIGKHPNVLALVGAVTKNMMNGEFYVIVEFCEHGDLKHFLESRRFKFVNELRAANMAVGDYIVADATKVSRYASELDQKWAEDAEHDRLLPDSSSLTTSDLLSFGMQVAQGMEYLSSRPCIHRDLAARNVLITSNFVCRIADFGLAKQENRDYYRLKTNIPLPRRWMSIEAIEDGLFTIESDVWSYGILLYEIFTLGSRPYPGISDDNLLSLTDKLKEGHRNPKPNYCHEEIYELMLECWQEQPTERPIFAQCVQLLKTHLERASPQLKERVEQNIREDAMKQNNLDRWIAQNADYRDQNMLPRKENGQTTGCFNWTWKKSDEQELIMKPV